MSVSKNALTVLEKRYLRKDDDGNVIESPEELFRRVADVLAAPDALYGASSEQVKETSDDFFLFISSGDFMPNSPTLANAGTALGQLSACFVLGVPDDLGGIFETIKHQALIHQTGGGTGFSYSRLRPKNDRVGSTKGVSSGPVSFMDVFNAATEVIKQGGMRRGANMGILRIDHPDIMEFIEHKEDLTKLTNFNISVAVTDEFMEAYEAGEHYALRNPRTGLITGYLSARTVFKNIVKRAWSTGEPGLVFIDRMNVYCPVPWMGQYEATNPCGEQPLLENESCNLGSINVEKFVQIVRNTMPNGGLTEHVAMDWSRLAFAVHTATHLLDNVIDANKYPLQVIEDVTKATRKIGLGVMGFARLLFKLGIRYGSEESQHFAAQLMSFIDYHSKLESIRLAAQRGSFPARIGHEEESNGIYAMWFRERQEDENKHPAANYLALYESLKEFGIRNSTTTTIAPTGTISIIADTCGGCEPVFALAFKRWQADSEMYEVDNVFERELRQTYGDSFADMVIANVSLEENKGSLKATMANPDTITWPKEAEATMRKMAEVFVTSHDITPEEHVLIQAAFQAFNDSATSKTINFPEEAMPEQVEEAYQLAWETGCKGITVYRNNSRQFQPLSNAAIPVLASEQAAATCCNHPIIVEEEGCTKCKNCGYAACAIS